MNPAVLLAVVLFLPAPGRAALASTDTIFLNIRNKPIPKPQEYLLKRNRYQIHSDGSVWTPDGLTQVPVTETPTIMMRLASSQRLKALIQIDLILSGSAGEKYLTPAEYEGIKKVARENWAYFTLALRKNFRGYFSPQELETLNRDPAPVAAGEELAAEMKDPEPVAVYEPPLVAPPAPPKPAPAAAPSIATAFPKILQPLAQQNIQPPVLGQVAAPRVVPAPTPAPPPRPAPAAVSPAPPAMPVPAPAPVPTPALAAAVPVPAPAVAAAPRNEEGVSAVLRPLPYGAAPALDGGRGGPTVIVAAPPAALPAVPAPTPGAPSAKVPGAAPAAAEAAAPSMPPAAREIMQAEFEKWLLDAPYDRDGKAMLKLISELAPPAARARVLDVVLNTMPMIIIEAGRSGRSRSGAILSDEKPGELSYTIALNPGLVLYTKKRMFFGETTVLLSQSPEAFKLLHVAVPELDALKKDAMALKEQPGEWGRMRVYADGSQRTFYTHQQMAGALLRQLLLLSARRQGWSEDRFTTELYARTSQNLFYARVAGMLHDDRFLDPEARLDYRDWLEHPRDWHDRLTHSFAAGRGGGFEPGLAGAENAERFARDQIGACPSSLADEQTAREAARRRGLKAELAALRDGGLLTKEAADAAAKAVDAEPTPQALAPEACAKRWQDAAAAAQTAAQMIAELHQAEAQLRKEAGLNARP